MPRLLLYDAVECSTVLCCHILKQFGRMIPCLDQLLRRIQRTSLLRVISYPRLHVALFDLANATPRRYGGAGFSLSGLPAVVEASPSSSLGIDYLTTVDCSTRIAGFTAISKMQRARPEAASRLKNLQIPPQHAGLGS